MDKLSVKMNIETLYNTIQIKFALILCNKNRMEKATSAVSEGSRTVRRGTVRRRDSLP